MADEEKKGGNLFDQFTKSFEKGCKKATTSHKHDLGEKPKYDADVMASGAGGFTEPKDDGIKP